MGTSKACQCPSRVHGVVAGSSGRGYTGDMRGKVVVGVGIAAVVGLYWGRPDLMVLLLIVIGVGVYGWRHPDLDDWRGH